MSDSRVTKGALAQSLKTLMSKRPFAKISVGDICSACGMNRKSFYYHFKDKYDLVNWIFDAEFFQGGMYADGAKNGWECLGRVCVYLHSEQAFYRNAFRIVGQNSFREHFSDSIRPEVRRFLNGAFEDPNDERFAVDLLTEAFMIAIIQWLFAGVPVDTPEQFISRCSATLSTVADCVVSARGGWG